MKIKQIKQIKWKSVACVMNIEIIKSNVLIIVLSPMCIEIDEEYMS
jgi:hypothetical protein